VQRERQQRRRPDRGAALRRRGYTGHHQSTACQRRSDPDRCGSVVRGTDTGLARHHRRQPGNRLGKRRKVGFARLAQYLARP
jgi:hypothetical protein